VADCYAKAEEEEEGEEAGVTFKALTQMSSAAPGAIFALRSAMCQRRHRVVLLHFPWCTTGKLKGKVKRTPARAVAERYDETDEKDEEDAEAGLTLKALAQMASGADRCYHLLLQMAGFA